MNLQKKVRKKMYVNLIIVINLQGCVGANG